MTTGRTPFSLAPKSECLRVGVSPQGEKILIRQLGLDRVPRERECSPYLQDRDGVSHHEETGVFQLPFGGALQHTLGFFETPQEKIGGYKAGMPE